MNYQEGMKKSLNVKWKTSNCQSGESCWCRIIEPEQEIIDNEGEIIYIAGDGCIPKEYAEHIVELHNNQLINKR